MISTRHDIDDFGREPLATSVASGSLPPSQTIPSTNWDNARSQRRPSTSQRPPPSHSNSTAPLRPILKNRNPVMKQTPSQLANSNSMQYRYHYQRHHRANTIATEQQRLPRVYKRASASSSLYSQPSFSEDTLRVRKAAPVPEQRFPAPAEEYDSGWPPRGWQIYVSAMTHDYCYGQDHLETRPPLDDYLFDQETLTFIHPTSVPTNYLHERLSQPFTSPEQPESRPHGIKSPPPEPIVDKQSSTATSFDPVPSLKSPSSTSLSSKKSSKSSKSTRWTWRKRSKSTSQDVPPVPPLPPMPIVSVTVEQNDEKSAPPTSWPVESGIVVQSEVVQQRWDEEHLGSIPKAESPALQGSDSEGEVTPTESGPSSQQSLVAVAPQPQAVVQPTIKMTEVSSPTTTKTSLPTAQPDVPLLAKVHPRASTDPLDLCPPDSKTKTNVSASLDALHRPSLSFSSPLAFLRSPSSNHNQASAQATSRWSKWGSISSRNASEEVVPLSPRRPPAKLKKKRTLPPPSVDDRA